MVYVRDLLQRQGGLAPPPGPAKNNFPVGALVYAALSSWNTLSLTKQNFPKQPDPPLIHTPCATQSPLTSTSTYGRLKPKNKSQPHPNPNVPHGPPLR